MKRYLLVWLTVTTIFLLFVAVFNMLVDPYGLFRIVDKPGFNAIKPVASTHGAMTKAYQLVRIKPKILVLGNSRAEVGIDPSHPALAAKGSAIYNAALPGTGTNTSLRFLQHILAATANNPDRQPQMVIWGVDFMDFLIDANASSSAVMPDKEDARLLQTDQLNMSLRQQRLRDHAVATLNLTALIDAVQTIKNQNNPYSVDLTPSGFNPMRDYIKISSEEGYWNVFRQRDLESIKTYLHRPKDIFDASGKTSRKLDDLKEVMRLCRQRGIELRLFSYPYHAHLLEIIRITGHWSAFETWKRVMVKLLADEAKVAGKPAFEFWDFAGIDSLTTESIPPKGDRKAVMRYYWEAGHFKSELGNLIVNRMFGQSVQPAEFGVLLTPGNVEARIARVNDQVTEYGRTHAPEVAELGELVRNNYMHQKKIPSSEMLGTQTKQE